MYSKKWQRECLRLLASLKVFWGGSEVRRNFKPRKFFLLLRNSAKCKFVHSASKECVWGRRKFIHFVKVISWKMFWLPKGRWKMWRLVEVAFPPFHDLLPAADSRVGASIYYDSTERWGRISFFVFLSFHVYSFGIVLRHRASRFRAESGELLKAFLFVCFPLEAQLELASHRRH